MNLAQQYYYAMSVVAILLMALAVQIVSWRSRRSGESAESLKLERKYLRMALAGFTLLLLGGGLFLNASPAFVQMGRHVFTAVLCAVACVQCVHTLRKMRLHRAEQRLKDRGTSTLPRRVSLPSGWGREVLASGLLFALAWALFAFRLSAEVAVAFLPCIALVLGRPKANT